MREAGKSIPKFRLWFVQSERRSSQYSELNMTGLEIGGQYTRQWHSSEQEFDDITLSTLSVFSSDLYS